MSRKYDMERLAASGDLFGEMKNGKTPDFVKKVMTIENEDANKGSRAESISLELIRPCPRNPYRVELNDEMRELIASVKKEGVLMPVILRKLKEESESEAKGEHVAAGSNQEASGSRPYEIVSGHRRYMAAQEAGLTEIPAVIMDLNDAQADIIMVDSNLSREHISVSEKAKAYRLKYDAIKKSVGRNWETESEEKSNGEPGSPLKIRSAEEIAQEMGVSDRTIKNYIRLTELDEELLDKVDAKELTIKAGVQLSYLAKEVQKVVYRTLCSRGIEVDEETARKMRETFEGCQLTTEAAVVKVLEHEKIAEDEEAVG